MNPYEPRIAQLREVIDETPTIRTFVLEVRPPVLFEAGQFIELTVPGIGEAPFTPSSSPYDRGKLALTIMKVGRVTSGLFTLQPGATLGIRGPYGRRYPLEKFEGKEIVIAGGGVGLAPLRALFLALIHDPERYIKIIIRYGARTPKDILYKKELKRWREFAGVDFLQTVDVGDETWEGRVGVVTTILDRLPVRFIENSVAVVCGPPLMMKFTTQRLLELGVRGANIYLSMEKNMSCGAGKCGHCRMGSLFVCEDGPVLLWDDIKDFEEPFL
jgi:NAD(P)H-flavin reductase